MFTEDQLIPISALTHYVHCQRRCALVHIEQLWAENLFTAEGKNLHEKVHDTETESRGDIRIVRGLRLQSLRWGLVGQADVVEFLCSDKGIELDGVNGFWQPFPVEYKRGKAKLDESDDVQLCAQALCLEEMLHTTIPEGALFYGRLHRRKAVVLAAPLRIKTEQVICDVHALFESQITPKVKYVRKKCDSCSLCKVCMPKTTCVKKDVTGYVKRLLEL